jgi:periplasmic protein TonB
MFEYSFVPSGNTGRPLSVVVAGLGQVIVVGGLLLAQLFMGPSLPERGLLNAIMLAPVPTAPPAPPPPMVAKRIPRAAPVQRKFNPDALVSPVVVPKVVAIIDEAPPLATEAVVGGVPGGIPGVPLAGAGIGFISNAPPEAPPPPKTVAPAPPPPPAARRQIQVGGDVQAALLLVQTAPAYPLAARQGRIHGTVKLMAVIGTDGKIKNLTAVSGHALLVQAALEAVRHWIYRPTALDGVPVEVNTDIEVHFNLSALGLTS